MFPIGIHSNDIHIWSGLAHSRHAVSLQGGLLLEISSEFCNACLCAHKMKNRKDFFSPRGWGVAPLYSNTFS